MNHNDTRKAIREDLKKSSQAFLQISKCMNYLTKCSLTCSHNQFQACLIKKDELAKRINLLTRFI